MNKENKEILNIRYAILAKGKKEIEIKDYNETNTFGENCHHNLHLGTYPASNNIFKDNVYENKFISLIGINLDNFWIRLKFCLNLLFNY